MELKRYFELLRRWLWLLILGTVLGAISALVASSLEHPVYQATATFLNVRHIRHCCYVWLFFFSVFSHLFQCLHRVKIDKPSSTAPHGYH